MDSFKRVKELLTECGSKFYTYTSKVERPTTLLLKGLNSSHDEKEVVEKMKSLNIANVDFK